MTSKRLAADVPAMGEVATVVVVSSYGQKGRPAPKGQDDGTAFVVGFLVLAALVALYLYNQEQRRAEEESKRLAPCRHGTKGALQAPDTCRHCREEAEAERVAQWRQAEERRRQEELERERQAVVREQRKAALRAQLREVEYVSRLPPMEFERITCALFRRMGYEVDSTPGSGDHGIDAYLRKGKWRGVLQCKRYKSSVGEPALRDLYGAMHAEGADEAIVVTTGKVSEKARAWAKGKPILLIERNGLMELLRTYFGQGGVVPEGHEPLIDDDLFCGECGSMMVERNGYRGRFLGCSTFPECRFTRSLK